MSTYTHNALHEILRYSTVYRTRLNSSKQTFCVAVNERENVKKKPLNHLMKRKPAICSRRWSARRGQVSKDQSCRRPRLPLLFGGTWKRRLAFISGCRVALALQTEVSTVRKMVRLTDKPWVSPGCRMVTTPASSPCQRRRRGRGGQTFSLKPQR